MKSVPLSSIELPSGYKRKNIAEQIAQQRTMFDYVWKDTAKFRHEKIASHIPGLISIIKDSLAISIDLFANNLELNIKLDQVKEALIKIWHAAQEADNSQQYTMNFSIHLHKILAATIDAFRMNTTLYESPSYYGMTIYPGNCLEIINIMLKDYTYYRSYSNEAIIFILHRNPDKNVLNSHISPKTFVDQFFHQDYSVNLMLFDVISNPQLKETKKEPHWGTQSGAYKMINHDYIHSQNIITTFKFQEYTLYEFLKPVYEAIKYFQVINKNATTLLYNGVFLMFHEIISDAHFREEYQIINIPQNEQCSMNSIQMMINIVKSHSIEALENKTQHLCKVGDRYYKFLLRDRESVLKSGTDSNGKPFLPVIQVSEDKKRVLPIGRKGVGPLFVVENEEKGIEYVLASSAIPEDLRQERYNKMTLVLKDGYTRFWDTFSTLLDYYNTHELNCIDRTYSSNACAIL